MRRKEKILIVDDSAQNRLLLQALITGYTNYACRSAEDGTSALSAVETCEDDLPDLVLLDIMMPDMDGYEVARRLKSSPGTTDIPIIFITALEDTDSKMTAFQHGGADYVCKPFNKDELLARIDAHMRLKRLADELKEKNGQLKGLNNELEVRNAQLKLLNDQKNELIGVVAHDLRNPLTVVMGVGELLERQLFDTATDRQRTYLANIKSSSLLMLNIINNLLDIRMIETGKLGLTLIKTSLVALIRQNVEFNNLLAEPKQIKILFNGPQSVPALLLDPPRIEQVLNNLFSNAVKYSHPGSTVEVAMAVADSKVDVMVRDHGQGIPTHELDRIFQPFEKGSPKPTAGEKSTGLGLAIVKKIVEAHGGSVAVESQVGVGTTFRVSLPVT
jgi:two-component system, sensor histidine kinase and response regulator